MHVLALCGSLRAASLNAMLLRALPLLAPAGMTIDIYDGMAQLPLFNPDVEALDPPPVQHLRQALLAAKGIIIASPEYAHGISGVMKNALDWMVGNETFVGKPVMLLNASPRATHAQAALREVLTTMSAIVVEKACLAVPLLGSGLTEQVLLQRAEFTDPLAKALAHFANVIERTTPIM